MKTAAVQRILVGEPYQLVADGMGTRVDYILLLQRKEEGWLQSVLTVDVRHTGVAALFLYRGVFIPQIPSSDSWMTTTSDGAGVRICL